MRINFSLICFSVLLLLLISKVSAQFAKCIPNDNESANYTINTPDGMTLFIEERGNINNPTIIFTHGFFSNRLAWETTFTSHGPISNNYHLVRWDLRGMGDSSKDTEANKYNNLKLYGQDVDSLVNNIKQRKGNNPSKIILVTWSTGSTATLTYLNNNNNNNNNNNTNTNTNVDGFVCVGCNFMSFQTDGVFSDYIKVTIGSMVTSQTYNFIMNSFQIFIKSLTSVNSLSPFQPITTNLFLGMGANSPAESRLAFGQLSYNYTQTFIDLSIPTLIIYGTGDKVVNPTHSQTIANLRANNGLNRVIPYNNVGHVPMWEDETTFENDLDAWIRAAVLNNDNNNPKGPGNPFPLALQKNGKNKKH